MGLSNKKEYRHCDPPAGGEAISMLKNLKIASSTGNYRDPRNDVRFGQPY